MPTPSIEHSNMRKISTDIHQRAQHQEIMYTNTKHEQKPKHQQQTRLKYARFVVSKVQTKHDEPKSTWWWEIRMCGEGWWEIRMCGEGWREDTMCGEGWREKRMCEEGCRDQSCCCAEWCGGTCANCWRCARCALTWCRHTFQFLLCVTSPEASRSHYLDTGIHLRWCGLLIVQIQISQMFV